MTKALQSPWLAHRRKIRAHGRLRQSFSTDVVIVGAGIAGISTAYFALRDTRAQVVVLEATRIAHGATGHNAGQLVSYFERPFHEIVEEFGVDVAVSGQHEIFAAWELIADMQKDLKLKTPLLSFTGYAGIADENTLYSHLDDALIKYQAGIVTEQIYVADTVARRLKLPKKYSPVYLTIPHREVLDRLETGDKRYLGLISGRKGCMNSAAFTAEVAQALRTAYPDRFQIFEDSPVEQVELFHRRALVRVDKYELRAQRVVLCTNGFENFSIMNRAGGEIDTKFHHLVRGSVGYMAAFVEEPLEYPTAISYLPEQTTQAGAYETEPYFYLTRRPYFHTGGRAREDLICVGGPEMLVDDTRTYSKLHPYPEEAQSQILQFLKKTYRHVGKKLTFKFFWHGLMGYTPNGVRCVGVEPCNPVLLYNLGCNGVGILPSVSGGARISKILRGDQLPPSIFDPQDQRCMTPERTLAKRYISHGFLIGSAVTMVLLAIVRIALSVIF